MEKKKLKLKELKLNSFITEVGHHEKKTVDGGNFTIIIEITSIILSLTITTGDTKAIPPSQNTNPGYRILTPLTDAGETRPGGACLI